MLLLAAFAAAATPPQARATVRIVRAERITSEGWRRSSRRREIVVRDGDRLVRVRLVEFE
jgi:hypothetical protein